MFTCVNHIAVLKILTIVTIMRVFHNLDRTRPEPCRTDLGHFQSMFEDVQILRREVVVAV